MEIQHSEMPLQADGSVYHLNLRPDELADTVLLVGDPGRVAVISSRFDVIEVKKQNREMLTHTGLYQGKRISVVSTGMGTDNLDIVMNELDALVNIDLDKRIVKSSHKSLNLIRLGTCGSLQSDLEVNTCIASAYSLGLDGLLHYYKHNQDMSEKEIVDRFIEKTAWRPVFPYPYAVAASDDLLQQIAFDMSKGITVTASGFYAPQCRMLRLPLGMPDFAQQLINVECKGFKFTNMEMETSALYGLSKLLGHKALTVCLVIANRPNGTFSEDYKPAIGKLIETVLKRVTKL
ncbi:MAG: nucleoside phosphorylase [Bacteroidales bacterium]|jgi:uridine phosphorylase|nr:nucleoside phosphorylase [Bacteroidales bacterium]